MFRSQLLFFNFFFNHFSATLTESTTKKAINLKVRCRSSGVLKGSLEVPYSFSSQSAAALITFLITSNNLDPKSCAEEM